MNIKSLVIFLVALIVFASCSGTNEPSLVPEIAGGVDSLRQIYTPSANVAL